MKLVILVVEDEPPVRTALARDLASFADTTRIELAESVEDAQTVIDEVTAAGDEVALILSDHRLPGTTGVDFLISSTSDRRVANARRILVTGQAGLQDTIRAINEGHISHYVAKPWDSDELQKIVRDELTEYVLGNDIDPLSVLGAIDATRAMKALSQRPGGLTT